MEVPLVTTDIEEDVSVLSKVQNCSNIHFYKR